MDTVRQKSWSCRSIGIVTVGILIIALSACGQARKQSDPEPGENAMTLKVNSPAFEDGNNIPVEYTGDGADVSPPLNWDKVPDAAAALVVIADDPDAPAGTWVHWVIYNILPTRDGLPRNVPTDERVLDGACQGTNDFKKIGYGGPAPPAGKAHRYFFTVYAVDQKLEDKPGMSKKEVLDAIDGHVLAKGKTMGTYQR